MAHDVLEDHEGRKTTHAAAVEGEDFAGAGGVAVLLDAEEGWGGPGLLAGFGGLGKKVFVSGCLGKRVISLEGGAKEMGLRTCVGGATCTCGEGVTTGCVYGEIGFGCCIGVG